MTAQALRTVIAALLAVTLLVLGLLASVFYLALGYFVVPIFVLGAALAVIVTRRQWKAAAAPPLGMAGVLAAYVGITWFAWATLVDQEVERVYTMRWESRGSDNAHGAAEVVLHFVEYPGHYVGEYSDDLHAHLVGRGENPVTVAFSVTRDLGWCTRGFHATRVAGLTSWRSVWGYAGASGATPSPWENPWWCP